jgi:diguanylate cyclase (GGDEF)-like protein/PAS domain S-box-containing protein
MAKRKYTLVLILILIILNSFLLGLDAKKRINQYLIGKWTNKEGLPQNSATVINQTADGYIWIGTQEGVVRFDGINMTTFSSGNTAEFKSNIITSLLEDALGNLWIGTFNGLLRYSKEKFKAFSIDDGLVYGLIRCLKIDGKGDLWIGTDEGICRYSQGKFFTKPILKGELSNHVIAIITESKFGLLIATKDEIYKLEGEEFVPLNLHASVKSEISALHFDHLNNLWIGTVGRGLFKYSKGNLTRFRENKTLSGNYITSIIEDNQGNLWIGTQSGGLNRVCNNLIESLTKKDGLSGNSILTLFEDKKKNLWIGTAGAGLNRLRDGKVTVYGPVDGLKSDDIRTVFEDSKGYLWVGANYGQLNRYEDGRFTEIDIKRAVRSNVIRAIMEGPQGAIWIGTVGSGVFLLKNNKIQKFGENDRVETNSVFSLLKGSDGTMWIGTNGGLCSYKDEVLHHYSASEGRAMNSVRALAEDNSGRIWFSVEGRGLARIDNGNFTFFNKAKGLSSNIVTCIYFDKENTAWIGTYGGGLNWIRKGKIGNITMKNGLTNNVIYTVLEEGGRLWMSSNNGIFNVEKELLLKFEAGNLERVSCTGFNESSGMKNRECNGGNSPAGWKDRKGILWFPTVKGLIKIDPEDIKQDENFPSLAIEKVFVDGKNVNTEEDTIIIPPGYKRIEFQYTALIFTNPKDIQFRVRLKGMENDWVSMGTVRRTYYTLIPPGEYTFEVISTNGEGRWNEIPVGLKIYLKPFFYQTLTFRIFVIIFLIAGTLMLIRWRFRALSKRKAELELEVKNRTNEIRQQNIELEKLSIVARQTDNGVIITSADGTIEWVNEGFVRMYGFTLKQLVEERGDNVILQSSREDFEVIFKKCLKDKEPVIYESSNKTRQGVVLWTQTAMTPILSETGEVKQLILVETDISKLKQAYDEMKNMSLTDPLTKLKNRRYFHNLIDRDIQIARRKLFKKSKKGLIYSMLFLMIDIDFFKKVNDIYGHKIGDQLLIQVSNRMKNTLRASDLLVRWGGEEFLVMSKDDNFEGARLLSVRLLETIEEEVFKLDGIKVDITISIGFCGFPILPENPNLFGWEDIVHLADSALYIAKNSGRKRSVGVKMVNDKMTDDNCKLLKKHFHKAIDQGIIKIITSHRNFEKKE